MNYQAIIDKYYPVDTPIYHLLMSHSRSVADKSLSIIRRHGFDVNTAFVEEAAMLHDIGIFLTNAPVIECFGSHQYIEHGYLGADIVRREGYPFHALVCERHTGTGLSTDEIVRRRLPLPHRDMRPISLEEQIICYADLFFSKTHLDVEKPIDIVRQRVAAFGDESLNTFERWVSIFE